MGHVERASEMTGIPVDAFTRMALADAVEDAYLVTDCEEAMEMLDEGPTRYMMDDLREIFGLFGRDGEHAED